MFESLRTLHTNNHLFQFFIFRMFKFIKKRSNSRVEKVVNDEVQFINQLKSQHAVDGDEVNGDEDSGYGENRLSPSSRMKSFSCEDLLVVGSYSQNRRRQSSANEISRVNPKSTSSTCSSTSEEQIPSRPRCPILRLCEDKEQGKPTNHDYENDPVKFRNKKPSVHLKVFLLYF